MTTWLVLGSSVSAPAEYERARPFADKVITSNRGVKIEPNPDWYWLTDNVAVDRYLPLIHPALGNGTKLVTSQLAIRIDPRLAPVADCVLDYNRRYGVEWRRGHYVNGRASGCMALQFAANQGPTRILMVGMEGYLSDREHIEVEYFDGEKGAAKCAVLMNTYGTIVQSVIDQSPLIDFFFFGKLNYPWRGLTVVEPGPVTELEPAHAHAP